MSGIKVNFPTVTSLTSLTPPDVVAGEAVGQAAETMPMPVTDHFAEVASTGPHKLTPQDHSKHIGKSIAPRPPVAWETTSPRVSTASRIDVLPVAHEMAPRRSPPTCARYLLNRKQSLKDDLALKAGLPIATGVLQGARGGA
jgi:hypothetical protein